MKQAANLYITCDPADLARLDHHRGSFHASPPEREELALTLMRYASAKVERQPWLLSLICRLFGEAGNGDAADIDGPIISPELRASMNDCMATRHCGQQEAFEVITKIGMTHGAMCRWQDGRRGL